MAHRATMANVACRVGGVSLMTVSGVINHQGKVNPTWFAECPTRLLDTRYQMFPSLESATGGSMETC